MRVAYDVESLTDETFDIPHGHGQRTQAFSQTLVVSVPLRQPNLSDLNRPGFPGERVM